MKHSELFGNLENKIAKNNSFTTINPFHGRQFRLNVSIPFENENKKKAIAHDRQRPVTWPTFTR